VLSPGFSYLPEEYEPLLTRREKQILAAWGLGTVAFSVIDTVCHTRWPTYSTFLRWGFRTEHPIGRVTLGISLVVLYAHLARTPRNRRA